MRYCQITFLRSVDLLKYCNKNCRCLKDSDFRPVCESLGTYTYYSPCYAGCTSIIHVDNVKIYSGCSCVEDMTGWGNDQAKDGPCDSTRCQAGWMLFEVSIIGFLTSRLKRFRGNYNSEISKSRFTTEKSLFSFFLFLFFSLDLC